MNLRYVDNPMTISLDRLRELDAERPGTYLAQPKLDGWRHIAVHTPEGWVHQTKHGKPAKIDPELRSLFESLPWPAGIGLDCELVGPRHAGSKQQLRLFDVLYVGGDWMGHLPFAAREDALMNIGYWLPHSVAILRTSPLAPDCINVLLSRSNPGLVDFYSEQMQDPRSEGLVIRRADQKLLGSFTGCMDNPAMLKCKFKHVTEK